MTFSNKSHASDHEILQSLHEGAVGGHDIQKILLSSQLQTTTLMGTPENNWPGCRNDLIDHLPDGSVYTGEKGNVDPKIRSLLYRYEEVPTPNAKTPTGIKRSDHLLPPPYRPMDSMTSGQPSSSVLEVLKS